MTTHNIHFKLILGIATMITALIVACNPYAPEVYHGPDEVLYRQADSLYNASQYDLSAKNYTSLMQNYPSSSFYNASTYFAGRSYFKMGTQTPLDTNFLNTAIDLWSQIPHGSSYSERACFYSAQGIHYKSQFETAVSAYLGCKKAYPRSDTLEINMNSYLASKHILPGQL